MYLYFYQYHYNVLKRWNPMMCQQVHLWQTGTSCWHSWTGVTPLLISCHPCHIPPFTLSDPPPPLASLSMVFCWTKREAQALYDILLYHLYNSSYTIPNRAVQHTITPYNNTTLSYQIKNLICGNLICASRQSWVKLRGTRRIPKTSPTSHADTFRAKLLPTYTHTHARVVLMAMKLDSSTSW